MPENKTLDELKNALNASKVELLTILKSIGNEKRFKILRSLLTGEKSFEFLKNETDLQKTALANHLTILIDSGLVIKPEYGKYQINSDGELFLYALEAAYQKSIIKERTLTERLQQNQFSESFIKTFFGT